MKRSTLLSASASRPSRSQLSRVTNLPALRIVVAAAVLVGLIVLAALLATRPARAAATTYTWNQTGSASWAIATNWTPTRTTPAVDDILVFNNAATTTATNVPSQTIGQLVISGNTAVTLTNVAASTITLSIGQAVAGTDLDVQSGSSLTLTNGGTALTTQYTAGQTGTTGSIAGTVTVNAGATWNVTTGTTSTTSVAGTVINAGTITGTAATLTFANNGKYQHNFTTTAGTIPTATWSSGSTCEIIGYTSNSATPGGLGQAFHHFTWNCPSQTANPNFSANPTTVNGNFTVTNTGTGTIVLTGGTDFTLAIGGNYIQTGGTLNPANGNNGTATINISGDFSLTGGSIAQSGGNSNTSGEITFVKTGTQAFTSGGTVSGHVNFTVNSGSTLQMAAAATAVTGESFTLSSGATLGITSGVGITTAGATGNIQTTNRTYSTGASYIYNGSASQAVGNGLPATVNNLTIANTGSSGSNVVTLAQATTISSTLTVTSGIFDQGASFNLSVATVSVGSNGTLRNLGTGGLTLGAGGVTNAGTINFNSNGATCGDPDSILIRSSVGGTQRTWSGAGTFSMTDVNVRDQKVPGGATQPLQIIVNSGTDGAPTGSNTGWTFISTCSGPYTWIGGPSQDWQVPTNWSPIRATPATNDVLIFDGNVTPAPTVTNVPTQTNGALRLTNNVNGVTLNAATGGTTLTLSGATGTDFSVPSGTLLTLAGADALQISVSSGSTGTVGGQIILQGGAHRILGSAANPINFQSGSIFTTSTGFTGNPFGTTTNGSVIFASGSSAFFNAGNDPFGGSGNSVATFSLGSSQQFSVASAFSSDGRTYGNLTLTGSQSYSGTGTGVLTIFNDFTIVTGSTLTLSGSAGGDLNLLGNYADNGTFNANGRTVKFQGASLTQTVSKSVGTETMGDVFISKTGGSVKLLSPLTISGALQFNNSTSVLELNTKTLTLNGTVTGAGGLKGDLGGASLVVGGTGTLGTLNFVSGSQTLSSMTMNRTSSGLATLGSDLTIGTSLTLTNGILDTDTFTLILNGSTTSSGASTNSYVHGTMKKIYSSTGSFRFDLGEDGYSPVTINALGGSGDVTASAVHGFAIDNSNNNVLERFWTLTNNGITSANLTFQYLATDVHGTETSYIAFKKDGNTITHPASSIDATNHIGTVNGVTSFSIWTFAEPSAPTAVKLTGFTATTQDDGVMLEWKSGFEANNLGYHVYRYQDGQRTRVTPSLIAGSSLITKHGRDLSSGYSYGWFDPQGTMGTQYELQALDLHGDVQTFTPHYKARNGAHDNSQKARAALVTEVAANAPGTTAQNGWAKGMNTAADKKTAQASAQALATQQSIAAQQALKIRVDKSGWYRITQPQMVANGLDASADARKLQLYVDGVEVPIRLSTTKATLSAADTLEFYGAGLDTLTTGEHTYYLISGTRNGLRIPTTADKGNGKAKNEVLSPDFLYTVESKERTIYLPGLLNGEANNIFGQIVTTDPVTQNVSLQNVAAGGGAQLEVIIQGFTDVAHQVQVQLNGSYVGTINFSGAMHKSSTIAINGGLLREGANTVTLTAAGGDADISLVDALRMTYSHSYRADNDSLAFSVGSRAAFVTGFSSAAIRVIDVTNPGAVQELSPKITNSGGSYSFTVPATSTVQNLVAFVDSQARQPAALLANQPSTWNAGTNAADLVIVTHGDFRSSADTLAAARRAQGMKVSVVDVEDVYDEFSFGAHGPQGVKDFLAWSNTHWATGPKYALLFGDSSWDPRNFMGQGFSDYVPTKLLDTVEFETASDDWLADFNGDGIPEIAMGRLPVRTTADANTMVSKILNYDQERAGGTALRGAVLVSDGGFEDQTAQVQSYLSPITTVQTLNRSAIGNDDAMRTQIENALDAGPAIVNYFGHGSVGVWTGAGLLNQDNAAALTNGNRVTLFVMMTCLNGYSHDAFIDSLAETLLRNPQGGAFAVWASSGATEPVGQAQMNTQLYQALLGNQPMTLGDAVRQAKLATLDYDVRRTWILLGDPTMRLK